MVERFEAVEAYPVDDGAEVSFAGFNAIRVLIGDGFKHGL